MRLKYFLLVLLLGLARCAPEQSAEVRRRETAGRDYDRLSKAQGTYLGFVNISDTAAVPLSAEVTVTKNPTDAGEKPILSVAMRLGLFGGVKIVSTSASYDWGTSQLSAAFAKNSKPPANGTRSAVEAQRSLELIGHIEDGKWTEGFLVGSHLGKRPIVVEKTGKDLFDSSPEKNFDILWDEENNVSDAYGLFTVKRRSTTEESPATSDLPFLAGLDGAVKFELFASTPQTARKILYDPLQGTLDAQFTDSAWLRTQGIFLSKKTWETPTKISGSVTLGGDVKKTLRLEPREKILEVTTELPGTYLGTWQGGPNSLSYKAIAFLDYQGSSGSTQPGLVFPNYPPLKLLIGICNGNEVYLYKDLKLDVLDYLNRTAIFWRAPGDIHPLEMVFNKNWSELNGVFLGSSEEERPKTRLRANKEVATKRCATVGDDERE